jgi:hypothetical protein
VQWRRVALLASVELPVAGSAPLFDRVRVRMLVGVIGGAVNLVPRAPAPTFLFIALCDGAHQPCRVGHPRSGRENKAQRSLGLMEKDQT